ncbi:hypothetical protein CERZMDRAFT_83836 [Cercospora zeae-maydis SCOH1-5]|uniref:ABM domain-containing protein n=1 Tax=Cercospora zeae-maydis SCOH1-5 TaxID=717836 RepID=A0A6A6FJX2_9PEZI|nr:hypothetical protein CERZMDRAFT_83836 [Cercospora zeae-maydis SCOH1-5]
MPELHALGPVVFATLSPFEGKRDDVKREFAALAQSVWDNEEHTRCYYWLYPEDAPNDMIVIEIYNGQKGVDIHATGPLTFDTFERVHQYGIRVDLPGLKRLKEGLPPIPTPPDVEEIGLTIDYAWPVGEIEHFLGDPKLDEQQRTVISRLQLKEGKNSDVIKVLAELAKHAKTSGKVESFWVCEEAKTPEKVIVLTRYLSEQQRGEFVQQEETKQLEEKLEDFVASRRDSKCTWAQQGFFLKKY